MVVEARVAQSNQYSGCKAMRVSSTPPVTATLNVSFVRLSSALASVQKEWFTVDAGSGTAAPSTRPRLYTMFHVTVSFANEASAIPEKFSMLANSSFAGCTAAR